MLAPEVWDFQPPKIITSSKQYENQDSVIQNINMNSFYKSLIITCPDEIQTPDMISEAVTEDSDFYRLSEASVAEFVEPMFIESFIKNGKLYCLSVDRNCIVQNCAAITSDGVLTLHVLEYIFQTIGLEGTKRPHNFYEININLIKLRHHEKVKQCLQKLEKLDFHIYWEPNREDICPSSIAKYFYDRNIKVSLESLEIKTVTPSITEVPSLEDVDTDEMVEWIGMLAIGGDLAPEQTYISTYSQPESEHALKTSRICIFIAKGFLTPATINKICGLMSKNVMSRELDGYWASMSIQSQENSLWQWSVSSPKMFQAHDSSRTIFFTHKGLTMYLVGQLKYS